MIALGTLTVVIWVAMLAARFWTTAENDEAAPHRAPELWPSVVAVVPARDEADVIARSLASLAAQDYPGDFRIILVDDNSSDGTAAIAAGLAAPRLAILAGAPLAPGWTGKLWALSQGIAAAGSPDYLWLTDADIAHAPDTLRRLVAIAHPGHADARKLVSFMAQLHCETAPERPLVPAFIYFFKMLYPFGWINKTHGFMAHWTGAAGGCVLVERAALETAGGVAAMRGALIDDCTLGALIKRQGPVWLGLSKRSRSLRPYRSADEIAAMISRSAYAQLRYNPLLLLGTFVGLALVFMAAPVLALLGDGPARLLGAATWAMMAWSWLPVLHWYHRSPLYAPLLPLVAGFYTWCTLASAFAYYRGKGGMWKGRAQAMARA